MARRTISGMTSALRCRGAMERTDASEACEACEAVRVCRGSEGEDMILREVTCPRPYLYIVSGA